MSLQPIKTFIYTLLARRDHSCAQIAQKLTKKGFDPQEINAVIDEFREAGIINEQRFVESYIHYRQSQGYGPLRIHQELLLRGVAKEIIEDQLNIADNTWLVQIRRVWQKRFAGKWPVNLAEQAQQCRFLQYRGFTQAQIESIFNNDND